LENDAPERGRHCPPSAAPPFLGLWPFGRALTVDLALTLIASSTLFIYTSRLAYKAWLHGTFIADDVVQFWFARTLPVTKFMMTPIDVHFVPVHRLFSLFVYRLAPLRFEAGLATLLVLHAITLATLYRIARAFVPRAVALLLVTVYGLHPNLAPLLMWWTSGLHRLGCVCFVSVALLAYLEHRRTSSKGWLFVLPAATLTACGMYSKGALIPLYLALLELNLVACKPLNRPAGKRWPAFVVVSLGVAGYLLAWRYVTSDQVNVVNHDASFLVELAIYGVRVFAPTVFGSWLDGNPLALWGSMALWFVIIGGTCVLSRRSALAWASFVVAVGVNMALIGASGARAKFIGYALLLVDRYYVECAFLLVPFAAIAFATAFEGPRFEALSRARWAGALAAAAVLLGLIGLSIASSRSFSRSRRLHYASYDFARRYTNNLRTSVARLPASRRKHLSLRDSQVPIELVPMSQVATMASDLLTLMGEHPVPSADGAYEVRSTGVIVLHED
jgi:hypothetical protein